MQQENQIAGTAQTKFQVGGMDCAGCASKISTAVQRLPGVSQVDISVSAGTMRVTHQDAPLVTQSIVEQLTNLGYTASVALSGGSKETDAASQGNSTTRAMAWWRIPRVQLAIASGAAFILAYVSTALEPQLAPWPFTLAVLVGLIPIARRAIAAALAGTPFSIEMLMTIAALGALMIGASEEAAAVVFLFLIGEMLEGVAAGKARDSIKALINLVPATALLERDGRTSQVQAAGLSVGNVIMVRPGDRIAADGVILSGSGAIDESAVTGESVPVSKGRDAPVFAGTVNLEGVLRVRVTAASSDNTISRIVALVETAQESKAPTERFIDRFSRYYTPIVVLVAAAVAIGPPLLLGGDWQGWVYKGLAILLIGCPCALVISTPAAIAASLSAGARRGLLLKGGAVLEGLGRVTAVAFDKTGTLTSGRPVVTDVVAFGWPANDVLRYAAALEAGSSHPLATAILTRAASDRVSVPRADDGGALGGKGVVARIDEADVFLGSPQAVHARQPLSDRESDTIAALNDQGKTVSVLVVGDVIAGALAMRDEPRADATRGLQALAAIGVSTVMLTGDNRRTASAIGKQLDIEVRAELLPEDKQRIVGEMQQRGLIVAKVGDGINDAPALAAADVGIAMGSGTDVALETADAAILHGRVQDVAEMIALSRRTMTNIRQNLGIALGLKAMFLVTTIAGVTGLWPAILADTGATVLVTLNALRLLRNPSDN